MATRSQTAGLITRPLAHTSTHPKATPLRPAWARTRSFGAAPCPRTEEPRHYNKEEGVEPRRFVCRTEKGVQEKRVRGSHDVGDGVELLFKLFFRGVGLKWSHGGLHLTFFDIWKSSRSHSSSIKHFGGERGLPNNHHIPDCGFNE